jgi:secreted trypsin-like serine protease
MLKGIGRFVRVSALAGAIAIAASTHAGAIFGGKPVAPRAYPFMVSMRIEKGGSTFLCGGSLIAEQ